jgi:hypothetical protein
LAIVSCTALMISICSLSWITVLTTCDTRARAQSMWWHRGSLLVESVELAWAIDVVCEWLVRGSVQTPRGSAFTLFTDLT